MELQPSPMGARQEEKGKEEGREVPSPSGISLFTEIFLETYTQQLLLDTREVGNATFPGKLLAKGNHILRGRKRKRWTWGGDSWHLLPHGAVPLLSLHCLPGVPRPQAQGRLHATLPAQPL